MESKTFLPITILLVIASFVVGTQWSKLLKKEVLVKASPSSVPQQQAQTPSQPQVLGAEAMENLVKEGVVLGEASARVTVVEFSDPSCPYCAAAAGADIVVGKDESGNQIRIISDVLKKRSPDWEAPGPKLEALAKNGKIRLVFRYYPGHGTGEKAMMAAWCAADQDESKFWGFLGRLFANQDEISDVQKIVDLGAALGLDKQKLLDCTQSDKYKERIQKDMAAGQEAAKQVSDKEGFGTPTFFVNGTQIVGAQDWEVFASLIDKELTQ